MAAALFWSEFEQAGSTLNLFADRSTDNSLFGYEFPSTWFQSLNSVFIITLAPVFAWVWIWLGRRGQEPSSTIKFGIGLVLVGAGFAVLVGAAVLAEQGVQVSPMWLVADILPSHVRRAVAEPGGHERHDEAGAGPYWRTRSWASGSSRYRRATTSAAASLRCTRRWTLPQLFGAVGAFGIAAGIVMFLISRPVARLEHEAR